MSKEFVHLHLHTDFSLLDGAIQHAPLAKRLNELQMKAAAITDHGNLFGAISFYDTMRSAGIKPIIGMEAYLASGSRFDKAVRPEQEKYHHLVLLTKDLQGYHNLVKLSSMGYIEGYHYRPRID